MINTLFTYKIENWKKYLKKSRPINNLCFIKKHKTCFEFQLLIPCTKSGCCTLCFKKFVSSWLRSRENGWNSLFCLFSSTKNLSTLKLNDPIINIKATIIKNLRLKANWKRKLKNHLKIKFKAKKKKKKKLHITYTNIRQCIAFINKKKRIMIIIKDDTKEFAWDPNQIKTKY